MSTEAQLRSGLQQLVDDDPPPPELTERLLAAADQPHARGPRRPWLPVAAVAASVVVIAVVAGAVVRRGSTPSPAASPPPSTAPSAHCVPSLPAGPAPHAGGLGPNPSGVAAFWIVVGHCIEQVSGTESLAQELVTALLGAPSGRDDCGSDRSAVLLQFSYATAGVASVSGRADGCGGVTLPDGSTVRPSTRFYLLLNQLAPPGVPTPYAEHGFIPSGTTFDCTLLDPAEGASPGPMPSDPSRVTATWQPGGNASDCREPVTTGSAALARQLAAELAAAPARPRGIYNCPMDDGKGTHLFFSGAPGRPPATVYVRLSGCRFVIRADGRDVAPPTSFYATLALLAPPNLKAVVH